MKTKIRPNIILMYIVVYVLFMAILVAVAYFIGYRFLQLPARDMIISLALCILAFGIGTTNGIIKVSKKRNGQ